MRTRQSSNITLAVAVAGCAALIADTACAETRRAVEVLTLPATAELLQVPTETVLDMATAGTIPARRVGDHWRFSRAAVLVWLQGDAGSARPVGTETDREPQVPAAAGSSTKDVPVRPVSAEPAPTSDRLSSSRLAVVTGRGDTDQPPRAAVSQRPSGTVGEPRSRPTAEEAALSQQDVVLLGAGQATLQAGVAYARQERESFGQLRVEQNTTSFSLTGRYGIKDDLQLSARLPMVYRRTRLFALAGDLEDGTTDIEETDSYFGDAALSLLGVAVREGIGRPNLIWSLDTVLPTGPGDTGVGGGLLFSKSYDPVVVFGGVSYLYGSDIDSTDLRRELARHNLGFNLGYTYAVNDTIALSGLFAGTYRTPREGALPPEKESYLVQLGATWVVGPNLFFDPSVGFGVGGVAPDLSLSANLLYAF